MTVIHLDPEARKRLEEFAQREKEREEVRLGIQRFLSPHRPKGKRDR